MLCTYLLLIYSHFALAWHFFRVFFYSYTSILFRLPHEIFSLFRPPNRCRLLEATAAATRLGIGERLWFKMSLLMPLRMNRGLFGTGLPPVVRRGVRRNEGMRLFKSVTCGIPISVVEPIFWICGRPFIKVPLNGCGWLCVGWRFAWFRLCWSAPGDGSQLLFWMCVCWWWWFSAIFVVPGVIVVGKNRSSITVRF